MKVFEAIKNRFSCRKYTDRPIEKEKLEQILEAARLAPSANNSQDWKLVVVQNSMLRKKLAKTTGQSFIGSAPVIIVAVNLKPEDISANGIRTSTIDLAIAVDHVTLAATELGLASCWIGSFDQDETKKVLQIPDQYKILALLPVGYAADFPGPKNRKAFAEIISFDIF